MNDQGADSTDLQIYVSVLENLEDAVIALDPDGRIVLFNSAAENSTGISRRQSLGRKVIDLFRTQETLLHLVQTALREGRSIFNYEDILLHRPGAAPLPISVSVSPIFTPAGTHEGVVVIMRDISRVRELEDAVRRADRLSMIGTMAAGLAHEIKNPLGGIKGAAQLLGREFSEPDDALNEYTDIMIREVERVNAIIEELMDLASPRPPVMTEVNLSRILGDIILFQKEAQRKKNIDFILRLDPSIPPIRGDENLLTRLFLNLIMNGCEAIENSGRVDIVTKVASEIHLNQPGDRPVPFIVIEIRDNGKGIARESLEQIFTPFFTTKNRGSGLGLAICQKIVTDHRGFLKVKSSPGKGTCFTISLPFYR